MVSKYLLKRLRTLISFPQESKDKSHNKNESLTSYDTKHKEKNWEEEAKREHQHIFVNNGGQDKHGHSCHLTVLNKLKETKLKQSVSLSQVNTDIKFLLKMSKLYEALLSKSHNLGGKCTQGDITPHREKRVQEALRVR